MLTVRALVGIDEEGAWRKTNYLVYCRALLTTWVWSCGRANWRNGTLILSQAHTCIWHTCGSECTRVLPAWGISRKTA